MKQSGCPNLAVCPNIPDFTLKVLRKSPLMHKLNAAFSTWHRHTGLGLAWTGSSKRGASPHRDDDWTADWRNGPSSYAKKGMFINHLFNLLVLKQIDEYLMVLL